MSQVIVKDNKTDMNRINIDDLKKILFSKSWD